MTEKNFKEAMQAIAYSEESEKYYNEINNIKKHKKIVKTGAICTAAVVAVAAVMLIAVKLSRPAKALPLTVNNGEDIIAAPTNLLTEPSDALATDLEIEPPASTGTSDELDILSIFGQANYVSSDTYEWFKNKTIGIKQLSYIGLNSEIKTFNASSLGTNLISTEVFGEHRDCPGVYYNPDKDEIVCLYHEFLDASKISLSEGSSVDFIADKLQKDLYAVRIYETNGLLTEGLWVFNRSTGNASALPLPDGCNGYNEIYIYTKSLCGGKLSVGVNTDDDRHFIYVYNTESKNGIKLMESDRGWISAEFLSERILLITNDGYSFYNVDTGKMVNVIGEYNYYAGGKVFSVKNWGWANHEDVAVAVYDAETGTQIDNETVLVQTVLDNGERVFLTKNTTTGEETVILDDYSWNCYTWSCDGSFFYAYSSNNRRLLCYSADDGQWFLTQVPAINTEPVTINGKDQAVFASYAISVADNNKDVLLFFTRTMEEIQEIPDYENEKVDSPYWDKYREMKALNFADEICFGIAVKENINVDGATIYFGSTDMDGFKFFLLSCLEKGTLVPEKQATSENYQSEELALDCGFLKMDFFYEDGICYLSLSYNMLQPVGWVTEIYEIPVNLFDEINGCCYNFMRTGSLFE